MDASVLFFLLRLLTLTLTLQSVFLPSALATSSLRRAQRASRNTASLVPRSVSSLAVRAPTYSAAGVYCDSDFFSVKHFNESGAGPWYAEWVYNEIHGNGSDWAERVSEPQYFALKTLHLMDLDCGVTHKGCINMPNCEEILERVGGDTGMARKIYYILQSFHNMNLLSGVMAEQSLSAETNLLGMAASIANTFFWKWDQHQQDKCDLWVGIARTVQSAAQMALMAVVPAIGVLDTEAVQKAALNAERRRVGWHAEAFESEVSLVLETRPWWRVSVQDPSDHLEPLTKVEPWTWTAKIPYKIAKAWNKYTQTPYWAIIPNVLAGIPATFDSPALVAGICSLFPNPDPNAVAGYIRQLDMTMQDAGRRYRRELGSLIGSLNRGVGSGKDGAFDSDRSTLMSEQIILGDIAALTPDEHERFVNNPSIIEEAMTSTFKNSLISSALKSQMCHLHCAPAEAGKENDCGAFRDKDGVEESKSRFCPRPGVVCQAQCWRNSKNSKVMELYGVGELTRADNPWDFAFGAYLQGSYDHWRDHRGQPDQMFPSVEDLLNDQVTDSFGSYLPVCYDEHIRPGDFLLDGGDKQIPCTCGDAYGNETAMFFKAAGFDNWVALQKDHVALGFRCMFNMWEAGVYPVEQYMTFCELGSHWPVDEDHHRRIQDGKDKHCGEMAQLVSELRGKGLDEDEVTCNVCFKSDLGKGIRDGQKRWVWDGPFYDANMIFDSMRAGCKSWATSYREKDPPCTLTAAEKKELRKWAHR